MRSVTSTPNHFFGYRDVPDQKRIFSIAVEDGEKQATRDYPYAVSRDTASISKQAMDFLDTYREMAMTGFTDINAIFRNQYAERWKSNATEIQRLYAPAFMSAYQQTVNELDKKEEAKKPRPQPQPTTTPATPSNTAMLQGAALILKRIERNADEYVYYIELEDPGYIDGVQTAEVVYPVVDEETSRSVRSGDWAMSAGPVIRSDESQYDQASYNSEISRKGKLYVRNVKKRS